MGKKLAFWIEVEIVETGAVPSLDRCPQERGTARLVGYYPTAPEHHRASHLIKTVKRDGIAV